MKMFIKTFLFALAFIIALVFFLHKRTNDDHLSLWQISADEIHSIEVKSATRSYRLLSKEGNWSIAEETESWEADPQQITAWIQPLLHPRARSTLGGSDGGIKDYARFGLDPPLARITIELSSKEKRQLLIGNMNPLKDSYFIQKLGTPSVYLFSVSDLAQFLKSRLDQLKKKDAKVSQPEATPEESGSP